MRRALVQWLRRPLPLMALAAFVLTACSTVDPRAGKQRPAAPVAPSAEPAPAASQSPSGPSPGAVLPSLPPSAQPGRRPGGYYQDDGPADAIPDGLHAIPDAEPRIEPMAKGPSRPYTVFDKTYVPITDDRPFVQRGIGSWYGRKFHGQKTASGELYDMFKMTAAHPTLPIPSYARVTNLQNGRKIIVRINDRGPFHPMRVIDLSYTAALKLDVLRGGSADLEVERILPDEILRMQAARQGRRETQVTTATPAAATTAAATATGFYLQFGAYALEQNAFAARTDLLRNWPAGLPQPEVVSYQGLFRLHSGPFGSREVATDAARRAREASAIYSTIVQR
jgi:rare lipoprotein A